MEQITDEPLRLGIDAGSKTIKLVMLDPDGSVRHSIYRRHGSNIRETLRDVIHESIWMKGDLRVTAAVTGSAGISVSELLGIPFVQEVVATTEAVKRIVPQTDVIIELGGEDAKVAYLTGGVEQRMNATCAGGTGGFIDTIAFMLGVSTSRLGNIAMGSKRIYPIASRCAVFAQTDVRPLLNQGASKADIAASALDAVVRQTLGGLACGRPIKGNVTFLGGPFEYLPALVESFRRSLNLDKKAVIKPNDAHLFTATGTALLASSSALNLKSLEAMLMDPSLDFNPEGIPRLAPLFADEDELVRFQERHKDSSFPTKRMYEAEGPLYVGMDCGSTTVKLVVMDEAGTLLLNDYRPSRGDTIETVNDMLISLYAELPDQVVSGKEKPYIAQAVATGYGEEMLIRGFGVDSGVVETTAHVRAARHVCPDATFVLDIGGQDMKALWLNGSYISDAVLNEACSSGCGAFVEGTAHSLRSNQYAFATAALRSKNPVDLGTRCTVFMSSRVKHAQKAGASVDDIAAGVAYSVVNNALYRIIGRDRIKSLGDEIVVQGGAFMSDAILRAFELTCGLEVYRPDRANLMGAIGAALIAKDRAHALAETTAQPVRSGLVDRAFLETMDCTRTTVNCEGCSNNCSLSVLDLGRGKRLVTGNRCERGVELYGDVNGIAAKRALPPNLIAAEQALLQSCADPKGMGRNGGADTDLQYPGAIAHPKRRELTVGLLNALEIYQFTPFWSHLLRELGFNVVIPDASLDSTLMSKSWETVPAESVCFPAKLAHAKAFNLAQKGACAIVFPAAVRNNHCSVSCEYAGALQDSVEWLRNGDIPLIAPELVSVRPLQIQRHDESMDALFSSLCELCASVGENLERDEFEAAFEKAMGAQADVQHTLVCMTDAALDALVNDPKQHAIILAGRPYHVDPSVMHGIDKMLNSMGFTVLGMTGLEPHFAAKKRSRNQGDPKEPACDGSVWKPAKHLLKAAGFAIDHPQVDLVCLQSFGCGYDAVSLEEVRDVLEHANRPYTALKVDEMVETAHIRIRLRTLAESIEGQKAAIAECRDGLDVYGRSSRGVLLDGVLCGEDSGSGSDAREACGKTVCVLDTPLGEEDLAVSRKYAVKDVCFTADVIAARAIRLLKEDPSIETLVLPRPCMHCLDESICRMIERACGSCPNIAWEEHFFDDASCQALCVSEVSDGHAGSTCDAHAPNCKPRIGIVGNPLLVFEPYMNDNIVDMLEGLGCEVVLPDSSALLTDDVSYMDVLEQFNAVGVHHVIYLQSFGCVKGHVHARGSHYRFTEAFPEMPVTVIDYDPEASALNRENRIRLIVESVHSRLQA